MRYNPYSLRNIIINYFRGRTGKDRIVSYGDLKKLAEDNQFKVSNLERRLRTEKNGLKLPIIKLGYDKKPIRGSQAAVYFKWTGAKTTVFNKV